MNNSSAESCSSTTIKQKDSLGEIIKGYELHPSIVKTREIAHFDEKFYLNLDPNKAIPFNDIPINTIKGCSDIISPYLTNLLNGSIKNNIFPDSLKLAEVTLAHKKKETTNKNNYRPVSVFPCISKLFEKMLYAQIHSFIDKFLSPYLLLYPFSKGYSTQDCLLVMVER